MLAATTREAARRFGDRPAYVFPGGESLSYGDLDRISDEVAAGLVHRGVGEGDVVALVLPPGAPYLLAYLGAARIGAITAGVNQRLAERERAAVIERAAPRLVLAGTDSQPDPEAEDEAARAETIAIATNAAPADALRELRSAGPTPPPLPDDPDRPVAIVFTSGTTGLPKGARYGNRQLAWITANDVGDAWGGGGRGYSGTPFAHLGFMTKLAGNLRRGGTTFVMPRWRASDALALIARERLTTVAGVPSQLALMLRRDDFDDHDLDCVQFIIVGGGPVTPGLAEEARRRFGARLATRYSCTEAGIGLGTGFDDPEEDAVVSVGRPHPGIDLALVDPEHDEAVAAGEVGRVCLRSPAMMTGYWRDPEETAAAFTPDGFVRTGDLGWLDDQGRLRLVGRATEMYVRGGENVYPVEVEGVLSTHPGVAAVVMVPRLDPVMGEVGVAVVVARDPAAPPSLEALRDYATGRLASYKLPEGLELVTELPLTAMEKVDRAALARRLVARRAASGRR